MSPARLDSCLPLPLENKILINVIDKAKDWALMHGAGMRDRKEFSKDSIQIAPFCLLPSPFPRKEFERAVELQPVLNELMHNVAHDVDFLEQTLVNTLEVDEFTNNLMKIWRTVRAEGVTQPWCVGLFRSDYLLQEAARSAQIKQVEFNTIASSFGGISTQLSNTYSYILSQLGRGDMVKNMPENNALWGLCSGIVDAFDLFNDKNAIVLFVVEEVSYNICDQRFHEFEIAEKRPDIQIVRKTLTEISDESTLDEQKNLIIDGHPIAVVYYRSGYEPAQYPSSKEWEARLRVERSTAIKCPSIHYHLAGTKKVQQALSERGCLERFINDEKQVEQVRQIFTGLYSLDFNEEGEKAIEMAMHDAERFVLKPQREGGGNNVYGSEVKSFLEKIRHSRERSAYILMERIRPPVVSGYIVRPKASVPPPLIDLVSELGIFGVVLGSKEKILVNKQVGHMLRTKVSDADEGGVAAGLGALDSPYLIDSC